MAIRGSSIACMAPMSFDGMDPLEDDAVGDGGLMISPRALVRIAMVAAETGARFQRDGSGDAMTWMLERRHLFSGRSALEACLGRAECTQAMLLHGLDFDPHAGLRQT